MSIFWIWWIAAAALVGAELLTGTFYLLAIGVAVALGGVAAWMDASLPIQFLVAGAFGVLLTTLAHHWRIRNPSSKPQDSLDVGQAVRVRTWNDDGTARVYYRGTEWDAELATTQTPRSDTLYIVETRGSTLVLADRPPRN